MNKQDENTIAIFVLNLIINGLPSILMKKIANITIRQKYNVLNLIINGLPSILSRNNESLKTALVWF